MEINQYALGNLQGEIVEINDIAVRNFVTDCIKDSPGKFWQRPSAFYVGHHPDDELREWGNLRHVKKVIKICRILSDIEDLPAKDRDILVAAMIVHDLGKYGVRGDAERIQHEHPLLVDDILPTKNIDIGVREEILKVVRSHMGRWGPFLPQSKIEILGHYADCIASRTAVNIPVILYD